MARGNWLSQLPEQKIREKNRPSESVFAKRRGFPYWRSMRWLRRSALISFPVLVLFLPSCGTHATGSNPGRHPNGTGPFDRNGNYVEAWADSPSKWGRSKPNAEEIASAAADTPSVAQSEEPPSDAVPLPTAGSSTVVKATAPKRRAGEVEVASLSKSKAKSKSGRASDDEDAPKSAKNRTRASAATAKAKTKRQVDDDEPAVATKSKTKAATASAKTKSKASASKAGATKSKAASRYTVKKGDNLTLIAKRNKTTVSAIQKANGLKGSTVVPGKTLVIPRP
jgi:LysM repeat protein